jgi:hypothetical protein
MQPLKNVVPSSDGELHVFYDFETTQNTQYSNTAWLHVPKLVCVRKFCSRCESSDNIDKDYTVRKEKAFILGEPRGRYVKLSV